MPLVDNAATSTGSVAGRGGAVPDDAAAEGPADPGAPAVDFAPAVEIAPGADVAVAPPGRRSARACVVSKVTVCENSCRRAPDDPSASCWLAALKSKV
ncbi:hypothetical protein DBZ45_00760 [Arthrobacter globiformis]|uniref:Uncharacterized protein n=1 Tax=Arthrobacter globiformis TaxID=1665 RepID=A0A328HM16_ARTGO|nr:hypothetical protein DBZ45_00760 [Arthrobacter globiformis]